MNFGGVEIILLAREHKRVRKCIRVQYGNGKFSQLTKESLPKYIIEKNKAKNLYSNSTILKDTEMEVIYQMLARYGDDTAGKERVAEELGISTRTLYRKLKV